MSNQKTLAMKLLDGKKISYEVQEYDSSLRDAQAVAAAIGAADGQVFKTLVVTRPRPAKPILVMIPSDRQLNLKKLAKAVSEKKLKMATQNEAERLTGLQVGGISALALINRRFDVFLDQSAQTLNKIIVSAGQRGLQIQVAVSDLVAVTGAHMVDATSE